MKFPENDFAKGQRGIKNIENTTSDKKDPVYPPGVRSRVGVGEDTLGGSQLGAWQS